MHKPTIAILVGALFLAAGGAFLVPAVFGDDDPPLVRWDATDEQEIQDPAEMASGEPTAEAALERTAAGPSEASTGADERRVEVTLRGRVVDRFKSPVPAATVWLDFGRGGPRGGGPAARQRRVPDPVQTDREGRFAFQGQTFRNLRVSLQVAHPAHAPGLFDKDLGEVAAEMDLGDLMLTAGGEVIGRITDLDGNGIAGARIQLSPENDNRMRWLRNRENLVADVATDNNGYYRHRRVAAGDWSIGASAKMHTEGRSSAFVVEEEQLTEVEDLRLGPGYEVTGYVRTAQSRPIAKANVTLRSQVRPGAVRAPGRGTAAGGDDWRGGREHRATTDEQGRFFLEHLPGVPMRLEADAEGYLDFAQDQVDVTLGQPLHVVMQDGLRIAGTVTDGIDGQPVVTFAARALRLRGLPAPGAAVDVNALVEQLRNGNLDEATRQQLRTQIESVRANLSDLRRGQGPGRGERFDDPRANGQGGPGRELGRPERHPGGEFLLTGLQEGVYEVLVQSPDHARFQSQEVELRLGAPSPTIPARLDRGVYVAGVVRSDKGVPVSGARVELRPSNAADGGRGRRGRGGNESGPGGNADFAAMARDFQRQMAGGLAALEATTDGAGEFVVKHAPRGAYRLQAQARGFANATTEPFELQGDRSDFELQLGALGSLAGRVRGLAPQEIGEARVAAVSVTGGFGGPGRGRGGQGGGAGGGPFQNASVNADGSYRIDDLVPGDYVVRSWVGSPQELMRELGPQFFAGTIPADVRVRGGETAELDVIVTRPQVGAVAGTVLHNGSPAAGSQIELTRLDENGEATGERMGRGPGGGPGGRGMFGGGRSFQAAVSASGQFTLKDLPVGSYRLRVQAGRRGGMLHEEQLQVAAGVTTERTIRVTTASLQGSVTCTDGKPSELNGAITLVMGLTELPPDWNQWRREPGNTTFDARVQSGTFRFETLQPGNYLMVLNLRGRERTTATVVVTPGDNPRATIAAGKPAAQPGPGGVPPANRQTGNRGR